MNGMQHYSAKPVMIPTCNVCPTAGCYGYRRQLPNGKAVFCPICRSRAWVHTMTVLLQAPSYQEMLSDDLLDLWEERGAIMEFDVGLSREEAEWQAFLRVQSEPYGSI
jgi:hypothetical protein